MQYIFFNTIIIIIMMGKCQILLLQISFHIYF